MAENPNYYAIIPADVRYAKIPDGAKLLYGEITALATKEGYCWANNTYFATLYGKSSDTISRWIKILATSGFIINDYDPTKDGKERRIYIGSSKQVSAKMPRGVGKNAVPPLAKMPTPPGKNAEHSITSNITINRNTETGDFQKNEIIESEKIQVPVKNSPIRDKIIEFIEFRKSIKKPIQKTSEQAFIRKLEKLSNGDNSLAIEILDESIANGWQGIFALNNSQKKPPEKFVHPNPACRFG